MQPGKTYESPISQILGRPADPAMDAAVPEFRSEVSRVAQTVAQMDPPTEEYLALCWSAVENIVAAYELGRESA